MHAYDPFPQQYPQPALSPIPGMRPARDVGAAGFSATPIFDALYAEFRRSFRTLPGDRSGEDELRFQSFTAGRDAGAGPASATGAGTGTSAGTGAMVRAARPGPAPGRGWSAYALPPGSGSGS